MSKFRRIPNVVEAFQWTGGPDQKEDPDWAIEAMNEGVMQFENVGTPQIAMIIKTHTGTVKAYPGYYIIQSVDGEIYPCNADVFLKMYEAVKS